MILAVGRHKDPAEIPPYRCRRRLKKPPFRANGGAHALPLEDEAPRRAGRRDEAASYLKLGAVATVLVATLLGLQPRINDYLGGESPSLMLAAAAVPLALPPAPASVEREEPPVAARTAAEAARPEAEPPALAVKAPPAELPAPQPAAATPAAPPAAVLTAAWVTQQPAQNYTLQWLASSKRESVDQFLRDHANLSPPLAIFEQVRDGQRLHVLLQGSYPDRGAALAAAKTLRGIEPWVRNFAGIKPLLVTESTPRPMQAAVSATPKDIAWVWSQDPSHYTVQLVGADDEASIETVMMGVNLPGQVAVVATVRQGKPWYTLVYGSFNSREAAVGSIALLPVPLQSAGPWARTFASLQEEAGRAPAAR